MKPINQKKGSMMNLSVRSLIVMTAIMGCMGLHTSVRSMQKGSVVEATCEQTLEGIRSKIGKVLMKFLTNPTAIHPDRLLELLETYLHEYLCVERHDSLEQLKAAIPSMRSMGKSDAKKMLEEFGSHIDESSFVIPDEVTQYCESSLKTNAQKYMFLRQVSAAFAMPVDSRSAQEIERAVFNS